MKRSRNLTFSVSNSSELESVIDTFENNSDGIYGNVYLSFEGVKTPQHYPCTVLINSTAWDNSISYSISYLY